MRILVIIAAYNEQENIADTVEELQSVCPGIDYIVVNDGSTDSTEQILRQNHIRHVRLPINLGIGGAIQTGYRYAREQGYDIAVQLDGDRQHDPSYIRALTDPIIAGEADYCIGSRFISNEGYQSSSLRRTGIRFLSGEIRLLTGRRIKDVTSGYRAVGRRSIAAFAENYPIDYPEPEAIVDAVMRRERIREIPVVMRNRKKGKSSITPWRSVYYMIKVTLDILICRISYGLRRDNNNQTEE